MEEQYKLVYSIENWLFTPGATPDISMKYKTKKVETENKVASRWQQVNVTYKNKQKAKKKASGQGWL